MLEKTAVEKICPQCGQAKHCKWCGCCLVCGDQTKKTEEIDIKICSNCNLLVHPFSE